MSGERDLVLKLAIRGLREVLLERPAPSDLTGGNATHVVRGRIVYELQRALGSWEMTKTEPAWLSVVESVPVDGMAYVGPTGGWVDFVDDDAELITTIAQQEVNWTRSQLATILRAVAVEE